MYIAALVIPVSEENRDACREWSEKGAAIFKKYGCMEIADCWDDYVPTAKLTDFDRTVAAKDGEKIAVSWQIWPHKESFYASEARMHEDNVLEVSGEIPFDPKRLIYGC